MELLTGKSVLNHEILDFALKSSDKTQPNCAHWNRPRKTWRLHGRQVTQETDDCQRTYCPSQNA